MIYGTVEFTVDDHACRAELTDSGWQVSSPDPKYSATLAETLDLLHSPSDLSPAAGDPIYYCVSRAAELLGGTFRLAELKPAPAGVIY